MKRWLGLLVLPLAIAWLHVVATWPVVGGAERVASELSRVPADLLLLLAIAVIGGAARWPRLVAVACTLLLVVGLATRTGNDVTQAGQGRPLVYDDLGLLRHVFDQWWDSLGDAKARWLTVSAHLARLLAVLVATWFAFVAVARRVGARRAEPALLALQAAALVGWLGCAQSPAFARGWRGSDLLAFADLFVDAAARALDPSVVEADVRRAQARMAAAPHDLGGLGGVDVHLLVIESYGRCAWRDEALRARVDAVWADVMPALRRRGFEVVTSALRPTIRGGGSWLAHAELLTSARVDMPSTFARVMASDVVPLTKVFGRAGYRVVEVMPAMDVHWPEGAAFYGVDEHVTALEFDYEGHAYPFAHVPDQFALHHALERVVLPAAQPLLLSFVSATSHAPWSLLPRYVDDWRIDARTFAEPPARDFGLTYEDALAFDRLVPAYVESLDYALRCAAGYAQRLPRASLVLVLGDHQPLFAPHLADQTRDVPLHVFCDRPELLQPLVELGFAPGIALPDDVEAMPLAEFAPAFLRAYAGRR